MGYDSDAEYEDVGRGSSRFLGFMFGNVNESGDLDVDYLDEHERENLSAFADKLTPSLTEQDLCDDAVDQDYDDGDDRTAVNAVDYFDIDEEIEETKEYDFLADQVSLPNLVAPTGDCVFDDENYDEEEVEEHDDLVIETENETGNNVEKKSEVISDKICTSTPPLPVLWMEDGLPVYQFSELFSTCNVPLKKKRKKGNRPSYSVRKQRHNESMDVCHDIVEDDEEGKFLNGCQSLAVKHDNDMSESSLDDGDSECAKLKKGLCFISGEPMKQDESVHLSAESEKRLGSKFNPLDQQDWEDGIVWGNSPLTSDRSADRCEISGLDHESSVTSDTEPNAYGLRNSSLASSESRCHPQFLRLESRFEVGERAGGTMKNGGVRHLTNKLSSQNRDMLEGSWLEQIIWDPDKPTERPKLILDLQDEHMHFEISDNKDAKHLRLHSRAMIVTRPVKSSNGETSELLDHERHFGWQDVASDTHYSKENTCQELKSSSKKRVARGIKVSHSQSAQVKKKSAATDLRGLSVEGAREALIKNGASDELIAKQTKGQPVAMIPKLSKEQAVSGVKVQSLGAAIDVNENESDHEEDICVLNSFAWDLENLLDAEESDHESTHDEANNSDLSSFAGDLENLLDVEECDEVDGVEGLRKRRCPSLQQTEEEIEDDETAKNKKKVRVSGEEVGLAPRSGTCFGFENPDRAAKENINGNVKEVKGMEKNDTTMHTGLINNELKVSLDGVKVLKERKSAREIVCGACGQPGHMRRNKKCPKYTYAARISAVEDSRVENLSPSTKFLKLKIKFGSTDKDVEQKPTVAIQSPANTDGDQVEISQKQPPSAEEQKEQHQYHKKLILRIPTKMLV